MSKKQHDRRRVARGPQYWHAGWKGRQIGELLLPLALQRSYYAEVQRQSLMMDRAASTDPDLSSGHIYDASKLYVTADRDFAEAWSVLVPPPEMRSRLLAVFGVEAGAVYGAELLDSEGNSLKTSPEPDPDYASGGSFQVELARVISVHRARMSPIAARIHLDRMAANL